MSLFALHANNSSLTNVICLYKQKRRFLTIHFPYFHNFGDQKYDDPNSHCMHPIRIDIFTVFILLGITQAVFLSFFFLSKKNRQHPYNLYQGLLLLAITTVMLEIFLMYSGYIKYALHLVDFSESVSLLLGPMFYFMVKSLIDKKKPRHIHRHLLIFYFYSAYLLFFLLQPIEVKYNAWVNAYHPNALMLPEETMFSDNPLGIRQYISKFTVLHITFYAILCAWETIKVFTREGESFWKPSTAVLKTLRNGVLTLASISIVIGLAEILYFNSTGEHLIAAFASLSVYALSFSVIRNSMVFNQAGFSGNKYKSSNLNSEDITSMARKIIDLMETEHPYLKENYSLTQLSQQLKGSSIHATSQAINEGLGMNFYELMASYRIKHAQKLLKDPHMTHLKIEEIAWQSGYNSKSSFNTAFRKHTGFTPSQFRASQV